MRKCLAGKPARAHWWCSGRETPAGVRSPRNRVHGFFGSWLAWTATLVGMLCPAAIADDEVPNFVRVEEDWVIEINQPAPDEDSPQITSVMSPCANLDGDYAVFELNHGTLTDYVNGGLQLQIWTGELAHSCIQKQPGVQLNTPNETVSYTSVMSVQNGKIRFEINNGESQTWGAFGGSGAILLESQSGHNVLNSYRPSASVKNSRVGFASNRVRKFWLKEVRYYSNAGLVATDPTERVVFQSSGGGG